MNTAVQIENSSECSTSLHVQASLQPEKNKYIQKQPDWLSLAFVVYGSFQTMIGQQL